MGAVGLAVPTPKRGRTNTVVCRLTQPGLVPSLGPWEDAQPEFDRCNSVIKEGRAMATLTADLERRLKRLPQDLQASFRMFPPTRSSGPSMQGLVR